MFRRTPMKRAARAFWVRSPGHGEIRDVPLPEPAADEVVVRTLCSGVSRGTETLVFRGGVPESQHTAMRAPFQDGEFPGPVKYGYLNVGLVEEGPASLLGRTVFCLYPHQTRYVVPASAVTPVPDTVPARRAVLAGTVETAVNARWERCRRPGAPVGPSPTGSRSRSICSPTRPWTRWSPANAPSRSCRRCCPPWPPATSRDCATGC